MKRLQLHAHRVEGKYLSERSLASFLLWCISQPRSDTYDRTRFTFTLPRFFFLTAFSSLTKLPYPARIGLFLWDETVKPWKSQCRFVAGYVALRTFLFSKKIPQMLYFTRLRPSK